MLPNFKTYSKATVIKTLWYWGKNRPMQQNSPEREPHKYNELIFEKEQRQYSEEQMSLQQMRLEQLDTHVKKKKKEPRHRPYTLHRGYFKMDQRPKHKIRNCKTARR